MAAAVTEIQNFINGAFVPTPEGAPVVESVNPATGNLNARMPGAYACPMLRSGSEPFTGLVDTNAEQVNAAVAAARAAFPRFARCAAWGLLSGGGARLTPRARPGSWSRLTRAERSTWLHRIADAVEARLDEFAALESADQGTVCMRGRLQVISRPSECNAQPASLVGRQAVLAGQERRHSARGVQLSLFRGRHPVRNQQLDHSGCHPGRQLHHAHAHWRGWPDYAVEPPAVPPDVEGVIHRLWSNIRDRSLR